MTDTRDPRRNHLLASLPDAEWQRWRPLLEWVDMAVWGWARAVPFVLGADAWEQLANVKRLLDDINARPAAQRVEALKAQYAYKTEMDDEARKVMFPQNARLASQAAA